MGTRAAGSCTLRLQREKYERVEAETKRVKPKVYLETTIPSYLAARPSRDLLVAAHQQVTRDWWERRRKDFDLFVSELVLQEIKFGDSVVADRRLALLDGVPVLAASEAALEMAEAIITSGPLPRRAGADALHIASAAVYGCEFLLTWNCRHLANAELQRSIRRIVEKYGFEPPNMCTPEELMGDAL
jgi:predicted nucleic acid-binding protein